MKRNWKNVVGKMQKTNLVEDDVREAKPVAKVEKKAPSNIKVNTISVVPKEYDLNDEILEALDAINKGEPVIYLAGKAGVGKSTFIHYLKTNMKKQTVFVAPTGIAALNIEGQTIHSFFRLPFKMVNIMEDIKDRDDDLIHAIELIVIDEVSMVRADIMDAIDYSLRKWRKNQKPFGGVQMLFVGDCFQLEPVVTYREKQAFYERYRSPWFFDAEVFANTEMECIELKTIYRQKGKNFVKVLNNIRTKTNLMQTIVYLNKQCVGKKQKSALYLTPTNEMANIVNRDELDALKGEVITYNGYRSGYIKLKGENLPVPEELNLKVGARVMVKKNIENAVNGSLGIIESCLPNAIMVNLDNGESVKIERATWETFKYEFNRETQQVEAITQGKYTQMPLILGWGVTIHKSQGLTLDSVELDLGRGCFSSGQAYVALSRCTKMETLSLTVPISQRDVIIDDNVIEFYNEAFVEN